MVQIAEHGTVFFLQDKGDVVRELPLGARQMVDAQHHPDECQQDEQRGHANQNFDHRPAPDRFNLRSIAD